MNTLDSRIHDQLLALYGDRNGMLETQQERYARLLQTHTAAFGVHKPVVFVSAPGRTEISGNHTDHNAGNVLAAAVNLDTLAAVSPRQDNQVTLASEGHAPIHINLDDLQPKEAERNTAASLVRGVAYWLKQKGYTLGGFDAVTVTGVYSGSGLSSSAAFEVLVCAIFDALYNNWTIDAVTRAQCAQYAENEFFGKPSGLMDQMASSFGSLIAIDFAGSEPDIRSLSYDFADHGFALVVVNTGGSHDDLTHCYAAIPQEMKAVAQFFGKSVLREVPPATFFAGIPALRQALPADICDRAILRAQHFYDENARVDDMVSALQRGDLPAFLEGIIASGRSSMMYLQNIYATPERQEMTLALMIAEKLLAGKGAWRIHGGGFAGTTLNFVPLSELESFVREMESVFGKEAATVLDIRAQGAAVITP